MTASTQPRAQSVILATRDETRQSHRRDKREPSSCCPEYSSREGPSQLYGFLLLLQTPQYMICDCSLYGPYRFITCDYNIV